MVVPPGNQQCECNVALCANSADIGEWWDAAEFFLLHFHVNNEPRTTARKFHAHGVCTVIEFHFLLRNTSQEIYNLLLEEQDTHFHCMKLLQADEYHM
jgi:hypothetical protein